MAHLARLYEFGHGSDRFFDRNIGIDAMLIVEIDHIDAEPFQAGLARRAHIRSASVDATHVGVGLAAKDAKFRGQKNFIAQTTNRSANQNFVVAVPVNIRGIKEGDAQFDGAVNCGDRLCIIALAVKFGHAHAAKAHCGHFRSGFS